jgi:putative transposase
MADEQELGEAELNAILDRLIRGKAPDEILGQTGVVGDLTRRLVERVLDGEMTAHLGYEKHAAAGRDGGNSRNGKSRKRVKTDTAELDLEVPRDRDGTFDPLMVAKGQRRLPGFDDKVIALYARGMTTREIQGHLKELYAVEVSPALISAVTDAVLDDVRAWQARPLEAVYPIVYLDAIHVKLRTAGHVQSQAVYLALAINLEGHKELLGLWIGESEGAKFWLSVLTELRNRGVQDILIAAVDGLTGFPDAIEAVFPKTQVQLCIVHLIRGSLRYVSWKERKVVVRDLKTIYQAPSLEAAIDALEAFSGQWDSRFPQISRMWRAHWSNLTPFFDYPPAIRKVIYTTNAVESVNAQLRKVTKHRGAFPTPDSARKVLYLAIMKASERWSRPVQDWTAALNHLSIVFEGRLPV